MPTIIRPLAGDHSFNCSICGDPATHRHDGALRCNKESCDKETERRHRKRSAIHHLHASAESLHLAAAHLTQAGHHEDAAKHIELGHQIAAAAKEHAKIK